jgi:hypothetical protein
MPYIENDQRVKFDTCIDKLATRIDTDGELTYVIYRLLLRFCELRRCYSTFATIMGVLSCLKDEFYRKEIAPYEDIKIKENGDCL